MNPALVRLVRRMLIALIVVVVVAVGVNYVQTWRRRVRLVRKAAEILSAEMLRSADSLEYSEYSKGVLRFKIKAEKLLETRKGRSLLEGIQAEDYDPEGKPRSHIRSRRADYDRDGKTALFTGDVRIQGQNGVEIRSESINYDLNLNVGVTEDKILFSSPEAKGTATGIRYDHAQNTIDLRKDIDLVLQRRLRDGEGDEKSEMVNVTSQEGHYSRGGRFLRFWGGARMSSESAQLAGDSVEASFAEDGQHLKSLLCTGNALYVTKDVDLERALHGDRIHMLVDQSAGNVELIIVEGNAGFASTAKDETQSLEAGALQIRMDPAEGTLTGLYAKTGVRFQSMRGQDETRLSAENLEAWFAQTGGSLSRLRVWERASMTTQREGDTDADSLHANDIRLEFGSDGGADFLRSLEADHSVHWLSPSRPATRQRKGQGTQDLRASALKMKYAKGGFPESGKATGGVQINLPPTPAARGPQMRQISAETVDVGFVAGESRLREFQGNGKVLVVYRGISGKKGEEKKEEEFQTSSDAVQAFFSSKDGSLENASQWGTFHYSDGTRIATSSRCDYDAIGDVVILRGNPRVVDTAATTTGDLIRLHRAEERMVVEGQVRSVLSSAGEARRSPFSSSSGSESPTVATSSTMIYWGKEDHARYSGDAQLLSENGQLRAASVDILEKGERIEAHGDVRHLVRSAPRGREVAQTPPSSSARNDRRAGRPTATDALVKSTDLLYRKGENSVEYSGGASLETGDVQMSSRHLVAFLNPDSGEVDKAAASGSLLVRQSGRVVRGETGDYFPNLGKFVVLGNLAEMRDPERGKSAARRLTFYTSDDRIFLEDR